MRAASAHEIDGCWSEWKMGSLSSTCLAVLVRPVDHDRHGHMDAIHKAVQGGAERDQALVIGEEVRRR
tara:strand:- start:112 stop:315 length:204 start_codon:yes stop_codon:yes gene_type:complete